LTRFSGWTVMKEGAKEMTDHSNFNLKIYD
jgi:hypothetical protein